MHASTRRIIRCMRRWLAALLVAAPVHAGAQQLLDFREGLAFRATTVEKFADIAYRRRLDALRADGRLDADPALLARVRGLIERLRPAAEYERPAARQFAWEAHVCRECGENASTMAGGKLLVGEEFVAVLAPSDDELGYLIAHEMAHALAEHTRAFASDARTFLGNGLARGYADIQNELDWNLAAQLRMSPAYGQQELDADYAGFILGARAGFRPEAMLSLLGKLPTGEDSALSPHANMQARLKQAQAMLETARRIRASGLAAQAHERP